MPQQSWVPAAIFLWICYLWSLLDTSLMLPEAGTGCVASGPWVQDSDVSQWQMSVWLWPWQPVWSYKQSTVCSCIFWSWLHVGKIKLCFSTAFTSTKPRGVSANVPRYPRIYLCLLSPASWLLGLVNKKAHSLKEPLIGSKGWGYWVSHETEVPFRLQWRQWLWFPTLEPHVWVFPGLFPEFGRVEPY